MEDFGLKLSSDSTRDIARFTLDPSLCADPGRPIVLVVRHAGRGNEAFMSAAFKQAAATKQPVEGYSAAADQLSREEEADLIARTVITGWENVPGDFSSERAKSFLLYLIQPRRSGEKDADYAFRLAEFDRLRLTCRSFGSFRGNAEELGKG